MNRLEFRLITWSRRDLDILAKCEVVLFPGKKQKLTPVARTKEDAYYILGKLIEGVDYHSTEVWSDRGGLPRQVVLFSRTGFKRWGMASRAPNPEGGSLAPQRVWLGWVVKTPRLAASRCLMPLMLMATSCLRWPPHLPRDFSGQKPRPPWLGVSSINPHPN